MIVPMKKATILVLADNAEATVAALRQLGVLHIEHQNPPESPDLPVLLESLTRIDTALGILNRVPEPERVRIPEQTTDSDPAMAADLIIGLDKQRVELESSERILRSRIADWEPWGDIDADRIQNLEKNGIYLKLYQVPARELKRFPADAFVRTIASSGDVTRCVVIARHPFDCPFEEITPPEAGLAALRENLRETHAALMRVNEEISRAAGFSLNLARMKEELKNEIEFRQVVSGMGWEGRIGYVTGYIPYDYEDDFIREARSRQWGTIITDPAPEDAVPTLLRNPPWVERIRPVFELLGITPGYRELDISMLFLIFFGIFFGILIGDAGYGLVYVLATLLLQKALKSPAGLRTTFSLFYFMGSFAILWGTLTGTFFGQAWLQNLGYQPLVPQLNNANDMQTFCFFLGALHLSIAHAWRAYVKLPSLTAIADAGWICILWTAFFLARTLILGAAFPSFGIWLVTAGIILVVVFAHPRASFLRTIGGGMGTVALSLVNNLTDVISYIRLFAVGLATLAIAETTNTLASGFGTGVAALVAGGVILIIGHSINLILGPMSVLVHGVRLNVLEFSGHANVTWSGVAFEPFREGSGGDHG
jgi:V/A-type H+-transporting ATPase subunit I